MKTLLLLLLSLPANAAIDPVISGGVTAGSVDTTKLSGGAVDTAKLNNDAVTAAKILNATISPAKLDGTASFQASSWIGTSYGSAGITGTTCSTTYGAKFCVRTATNQNLLVRAGSGMAGLEWVNDADGAYAGAQFAARDFAFINGGVTVVSSGTFVGSGSTDTGKIKIGGLTAPGCFTIGKSNGSGCSEFCNVGGTLTSGDDADCLADGTP